MNVTHKIVTIIFLVCGAYTICSQSLWESIEQVKTLIHNDNDEEAEALLNKIEKQCLYSDNDSIKVLYYESRAIILFDKEQHNECIPYFIKVIDLYERLHLKYQNYLDAFVAIGYSYGRLGDYDNAESFYRKAILKSVAANVSDTMFRPNVYRNLGNLYMEKGDTLLARESYNRTNNTDVEGFDFMKMNNLEDENSLWTSINLLVEQERYSEAAELYLQLIERIKERRGNKDESYMLAVYSRAILLSRYLKNSKEAIPLFKELVKIGDSLDRYNENVCGSYCNLVLSYSMNGNYDKANEIISLGMPYLQAANLDDYPCQMLYRFAGNGAYWNQDYLNAIRYYEQYLAMSIKRERGSNYEEIVNQLSVSYIRMNLPTKAQNLLTSLLKTDEQRLNTENRPILANAYHNLGRAYMLNGAKSNALKYLNKSKELQIALYGKAIERTLQYIDECNKK